MADPASASHRATPWLVTALVVGAMLRVLLAVAAPRWGYTGDHFEILGMGRVAMDRGLTRIYTATKEELPTVRGWMVTPDGRMVTSGRHNAVLPNYPPIATTVFWAQSRWLGVDDPAFVANTAYTRLVTSLASWVCELLIALGVGGLARALTGRAATGDDAAALTWLAPPLMMNGALFGQYDALALAPAVLAVLAMVHGRWLAAGVAVGVTFLAKPQGLLMPPIAAFAVLVAAPADVTSVVRRAAVLAAAAVVTIAVGSAPWMLTDGLAWVQRCYQMSFLDLYPFTTLEAHNLWYLIGLLADRYPGQDVRASNTIVAGLSYDTWGRLAIVTALLVVAALAWWRHRTRPALAIVLFATFWMWSTFMWPTRVHERYLLYCVPFLIAAAAAMPRLRMAVVIVVAIAAMEHSWMIWRQGPSLGTFDSRAAEPLHQERVEAYWRSHPMTMENAKAAPQLEEATALAFERYQAARRSSLWIDWTLTLLLLGTYAGALVVAFARPGDDEPAGDVLASA